MKKKTTQEQNEELPKILHPLEPTRTPKEKLRKAVEKVVQKRLRKSKK